MYAKTRNAYLGVPEAERVSAERMNAIAARIRPLLQAQVQ